MLYKRNLILENSDKDKYEHSSVEDSVLQYLSVKGDKRFVAGVPMRLIEFNRLTFFWEKLGLNRFDLDDCDPRWCDEIYQAHLGIEAYKRNEISKAQSSSGGSSSSRGGGREKVVTKLM